MPTYDYHCKACDHRFEEFQSMTAPLLRKCPKCGKLQLERLIGTGAALLFKGSGFYQTDYRSAGYKQAADADKSGAAPAAAPTASTAEAKPAAASPADKAAAAPAAAPAPASTPAPAAPSASASPAKSTGRGRKGR